jgi:hypothetical protein
LLNDHNILGIPDSAKKGDVWKFQLF